MLGGTIAMLKPLTHDLHTRAFRAAAAHFLSRLCGTGRASRACLTFALELGRPLSLARL